MFHIFSIRNWIWQDNIKVLKKFRKLLLDTSMFLNGSDISNVKGYAFSRAATLTEVSILKRLELKLNHHSILQSKKSS